MRSNHRPTVLVVGAPTAIVRRIAADVRRCGRVARVVAPASAAKVLGMSRAAAVVVAVERAADWTLFCRLAGLTEDPLVVVTPFLAADRRFRETAFAAGAAGYICPPFAAQNLDEMLRRVQAGERRVELVRPKTRLATPRTAGLSNAPTAAPRPRGPGRTVKRVK